MDVRVAKRKLDKLGVGIPQLDLGELKGWLIAIEGTERVGRAVVLDGGRLTPLHDGSAGA